VRSPRALAAVALAIGLGAALVRGVGPDDAVDLVAPLPRNGVVAADEYAPERGGPWLVTSGTLLTRDGQLWSGEPDAGPPDSAGRTGSAVLRAVSVRRDFQDVRVRVSLRMIALSSSARTPFRPWDGVHLFLRYADQDHLYSVDLQRRDGLLTIKRKAMTYTTLAETKLPGDHRWHSYEVGVTDLAGGTHLGLWVDNRRVLDVADRGSSALRGPGRVGLRGDNAEFRVRQFQVVPL
jgi:hypothetical protein